MSYELSKAGQLRGTATNDNASAGNIGEYISSVVSTAVNAPASTQYGDITSISLTAGDWDVTGIVVSLLNAATVTAIEGAITSTAGNSSAGIVTGDNDMLNLPPTAVTDTGVTIAGYRVSLAATTTYYLKMSATYSLGTPKFVGRISARRAR